MLEYTIDAAVVPLDVLVPQGRDTHVDYALRVPGPGESGHAPVNFHALAAASGGAFHAKSASVGENPRAVLVLVTRHVERTLAAVADLKSRGHRVFATWKECGRHQLAGTLQGAGHAGLLERLRAQVDGWIAVSPAAREVLAAWSPAVRWYDLPTPYPVDLPAWNMGRPWSERAGIFIGTREWDVPTRRHRQALQLALALAQRYPGMPVTCINPDGWRGRWRVWRMYRGRVDVRLLPPLPYADYLRAISRARLVLQCDASGVPGQVAGDALLARTPCLGGDGRIDEWAFGHLPCGAAADEAMVLQAAGSLLEDEAAWDAAMATAMQRAEARVSFAAFRRQWAEAWASLG